MSKAPINKFKSSICFLLSYNYISNTPDIICEKVTYLPVPIKYNNKSLFYYEISLDNNIKQNKMNEIKIFIDETPYSIRVYDIKQGKHFLLNEEMLNQNDNKLYKMNDLEIEDEFNIYYELYTDSKDIQNISLI